MTYIESLVADRKEFTASDHLRLPPNPRDLQIDYTSPTFTIPQKVKFRYRLENYERDWHQAGTRRQAFYTDLPPGKYSFRVIACNSEGVWNESAAQLDFSIAPAYYQTNWFRVLCACIFLALPWALYQWRVGQLQHQFDMTLDARVSERTRIARDLHDTLLQSAHGVLLRFQTVSQLLPDRPIEAKQNLDNAIDQTADFITEARDQVQGLRDSTVQSNDLALAISTLGQELGTGSAAQRPAFRVAVEGEARNLHPIVRDEIYKIAAEALRNAFRHSQARQIEVEIRYDKEQFRLRVRDDGKGVDPAILSGQGSQGHYGLPGIRERANLIGAKLVVWSEVDAGTEVELRVPASIAYTTSAKKFVVFAQGEGMKSELMGADISQIRILSVDDHPLVRQGIAGLVGIQPDMVMVGEASTGRDAIQQFRTHHPDITLMDLQMPEMNGIDALIAIRSEFPDAKVIVLTTYAGDTQIRRALKAGAQAYLLKNTLHKELLDTIRAVHTGKRLFPRKPRTRSPSMRRMTR